MTALELKSIMEMPVEQKIILIEEVWDAVRLESAKISVPDSHLKELDRRHEKYGGKPELLLTEQQLREVLENARSYFTGP